MLLRSLLVVLGVSLSLIEGKTRSIEDKRINSDKRWKSDSKGNIKDVKEEVTDVCSLDSLKNINMFCTCNNHGFQSATESHCMLFNQLEPANSPVWPAFKTQRNLYKLTFNVRSHADYYIPTYALSFLDKLKIIEIVYASIPVVTLGDNDIQEITTDVFVEVPSLRKLYIDGNNLSYIEEEAFEHLGSLEELELYGNRLHTVTRYTFYGLGSLKRLDMSNNSLTQLEEETFAEMPKLEEIILSSNQIRYIHPAALEGLAALNKLVLSGNQLTTLPERFLWNTPTVSFLDLRKNDLRMLTAATIQPIIGNFLNFSSYLFLDGNKLICDCRLSWMYRLANETQNDSMKKKIEKINCYMDESKDVELNSIALPSNLTQEPPQLLFSIPEESLPCPQEVRATASANVEWSSAAGGASSQLSITPVTFILLCLLFSHFLT